MFFNFLNIHRHSRIPFRKSGEFRYALGSGDRPLEIRVNGEIAVSSLSFPATGGWSTWNHTSPVLVKMIAGANKVRAISIGSNGGNVDHLRIAVFYPYGDFNQSGCVNTGDLILLANQWLQTVSCSGLTCTDLNNDTIIDLSDFTVVAKNWLEGNCP